MHSSQNMRNRASDVNLLSLFAQNEQPAKPPAQSAPRTVPSQVQLFIPYKQYSQEENQRILKLYAPLRVSDVSDGMDTVGLQDIGIVDESIRPLWKDTENFTHRIVGIAVTARYVPTNKRLAKTSDKDVENWYDNITGEPYMDALFPGRYWSLTPRETTTLAVLAPPTSGLAKARDARRHHQRRAGGQR